MINPPEDLHTILEVNDMDKRRPLDQDDDELFDELFSVASSMECTGLIPAAPVSASQADSYGDIYDIPLAKNSKDANNHMQDIRTDNTPTPRQHH